MTGISASVMFALFLIKHFICDFLLQTGNIAMKKHNYSTVESYAHSAFHALGAIVVIGLMGWSQYWWIGLLTGLIHYGIDFVKGNLNEKYELTPTMTMFWWLLGADQLAHGLTYAVTVGCISLFG